MSYDPKDPDYLYLAIDRKQLILDADPYEAAKSIMAPCKKEGYVAGEITGTKGDFVTVKLNKSGEEKTFKKDHVQLRNPPKFQLIEDMANMTYLSESAVLHNLRCRYEATLIYDAELAATACSTWMMKLSFCSSSCQHHTNPQMHII